MSLETKATGDAKVHLQQINKNFEEFKSVNNARLKELEKKKAVDPLTDEKLSKLDQQLNKQQALLNDLTVKMRQPLQAQDIITPIDEHKTAFHQYMRNGQTNALMALSETKSMSVSSDPDGGYLAPNETESLINTALRHISPMRQLASIRQIGGNTYRKAVATAGAAAGWVGETDPRNETTSPVLSALDFQTMELYAMPAATQSLLDDAIVDVEQWISDEVQQEFALQEGTAFINGDGVNKPTGVLGYNIVDDASQSWGDLGYIPTGAAGDFGADPLDNIIDLVYAPKQSYRQNGKFLMNREVVSALRKVKDADGNYIWQPATSAGQNATLLGYELVESEDMPGMASDAHAVIFGDFARGYLIVDRAGISVLRDPYSSKPYVLFYTTKRVGGGVQDFDALKVLKLSAS